MTSYRRNLQDFIIEDDRCQDLGALVKEGKLRQDLYFRLRALEIVIPPLRERLEDLPALVEHFKSLAQRDGESRAFDEGALQALSTYTWPGNIRELENLVHRLLLTSSATIGADDVRALLEKNGSRGRFSSAVLRSAPLGELLLDLEKEYLVQLHADRQGNLESMARRLGITVRALYDRFKRLGIRPQELK